MGAIEVGQRIRRAREGAELSYREVRAVTGLALSHLQRLERGQVAEPSPRVLWALASALTGAPGERRALYLGLMEAAGYVVPR